MREVPADVQPPKSVAERIFTVLSAFDHAHRAMTLAQISKRCGLPAPTTYRMLGTLEGLGAIERTPGGLYCIGPLVWELGVLAPTHDVIGQGLRSVLLQVAVRARMIVRVYGLRGETALCLEEVLPNGASAPGSGAGRAVALADSAAGEVILAQKMESSEGSDSTDNLISSSRILATRKRGWASVGLGDETYEYAVPIRAIGRPPMALSAATISRVRTDKTLSRPLAATQEQRLLSEMTAAASHIARALSETAWN